MLWWSDGSEISRCWKEMDEGRMTSPGRETAEELIRKVKTACNPTPPESAEEIWRQFNSPDNITKHTAMWNAEMWCSTKIITWNAHGDMEIWLAYVLSVLVFPLLVAWTQSCWFNLLFSSNFGPSATINDQLQEFPEGKTTGWYQCFRWKYNQQ